MLSTYSLPERVRVALDRYDHEEEGLTDLRHRDKWRRTRAPSKPRDE